ncbi:MAG TPA: GAF domain-containing sensor histidine kinase [Candidatus Binatia bacterium]|nr:GAF domain-containing sensor histidine kinase [Candidatus Binatia bacterium]
MRRARELQYAAAPALAALAVAIDALVPPLGRRSPFVVPFVALLAVAALGGLGPAIICAATAAALLGPAGWQAEWRLVAFAVLSLLVGLAGERALRRRAEGEKLRTAARDAERRFAFLADASAALTASLDYDVTLATVARMAVPFLADWCTVDLLEDAGVRRVALAYGDPSDAELVRGATIYPPDPDGRHPRTRVLRTGRSELFPVVRPTEVVAMATDPEQLRVMQAVGYRSAMIVALVAHGQILGAMTFATAESGRRYGPADLGLAEDLAHRAALAIDNARLFRSAQQARAEAEAASRAKDDFLAVVSHELRTPLAAALIWTRLLARDDVAVGRIKQAAGAIERSMQRQVRLVEDLLDVSRIVTGGLRLDRRPVDLVAVVIAAADQVRPVAEEKGVALGMATAPITAPVLGDPQRLEQVVVNLLQNAIEYTPVGGRVEVSLEGDPRGARIRVTDTGEGIPADLLPHVFERFRQADSTSTRSHGGLGLGLTIVRELVRLHGGEVRAESGGPGRGATFVVELPLAVEDAKAG